MGFYSMAAASIHSFSHTNGSSVSALHVTALRILRARFSLSGVTSQNDEVVRSKYFDVGSVTWSTYASKY
jgi:hypothetical protein